MRGKPKTIHGKNILRHMDEMEMSFTDLAKTLGITQPAASYFITGGGGLTSKKLLQMCDIFNCTPNDLMLSDGEAIKPKKLTVRQRNAIYTINELLEDV